MKKKIRILITGGAGFIGSNLCRSYKDKFPDSEIVAFDNLHRRGSEINLIDFKNRGIDFIHGDIRCQEDLAAINKNFDIFIEASAEPSVLTGIHHPDAYAMQTNLFGTVNCLNFAVRHTGWFNFLSTSRVYSLAPLLDIPLREGDTRFFIDPDKTLTTGLSKDGVSEEFPVNTARSLYGATKLASEILVQEYVHAYNLNAVINRCSVVCGPGQFGKVDQGVFTLWVINHFLKKGLKYTGFGGNGKQIRDLLHPNDLFNAINCQFEKKDDLSGEIFNLGGGENNSVSLLELTRLCREVTQNEIPIKNVPETASVDIPLYITNYRKAFQTFNWKPEYSVTDIVHDIYDWLKNNEDIIKTIFR